MLSAPLCTMSYTGLGIVAMVSATVATVLVMLYTVFGMASAPVAVSYTGSATVTALLGVGPVAMLCTVFGVVVMESYTGLGVVGDGASTSYNIICCVVRGGCGVSIH